MFLSLNADPLNMPPANWQYTLELLYVPPGISGAPPVGTTWDVPLDRTFTVSVPTFASHDGLLGYRFAFSVYAVPEPAAALGLTAALPFLTRRRQW